MERSDGSSFGALRRPRPARAERYYGADTTYVTARTPRSAFDAVFVFGLVRDPLAKFESGVRQVAEAPWSVAEWAVALRFDNPRATVLVLLLSDTPLVRVLGFQTP